MKDDSGDIQHQQVFKWLLPRYRKLASTNEEEYGEGNNEEGGDESNNKNIGLFEFLAGRMRNYMVHIVHYK